ncbi:MAG TPA: LuxR C-terminal-related transcriptional regulator [Candidatus Baltobacteraceae bacterium]|jgi:DNA-binding CsgD family transcriptional regulator|nr:LuxR C-terminal-related transcriptional regulator [Candidatus Baltobacteraceae bacterium]
MPLVGREKELALFGSVLRCLTGRRGRALIVGAGPGLGKSLLLDEFAARAQSFKIIRAALDPLQARPDCAPLEILLPPDYRRGAVVLVDDLHLAGPVQLQVFEQMVRQSVESRVAIVATYAQKTTDPPPHLAAKLVRWRQAGVLHHLMRPLALEEVELLLRSVATALSPGTDRAALHRIARLAAGSPRYALELLSDLQAGHRSNVPASARAEARACLACAPPAARRVLPIAATIGRKFQDTWLIAVSGEDAMAVADALQYAVDCGVLAEDVSKSGSYVFTDRAVQRALRETLVWSKRRALHSRIAHTLSAVTDPEHHAPLIAHHCDLASARESALWLPRAARYLASKNDLIGAARLYQRAVAYVTEGTAQWYELLTEAARCLEEIGRHESAIPLRESLVRAAERANDMHGTATALLALMTDYWWSGRYEEFHEAGHRLRGIDSPEVRDVVAGAIAMWSWIVFASGRRSEARALLSATDPALLVAEHTKTRYLLAKAIVESPLVPREETIGRLAQVTRAAEALGDPRVATGTFFTAAHAAAILGNLPTARDYVTRAAAFAAGIEGESRFKFWAALDMLEIRLLSGDLHGLNEFASTLLSARDNGGVFESHAAAHLVALGMRIGDPVLVDAFFDPRQLHDALLRRDVEVCGLLIGAYAGVMTARGMSAELAALCERCIAHDIVDPYYAVQLCAAQFAPLEVTAAAREQVARRQAFHDGAVARAALLLFDAHVERRKCRGALYVGLAHAAAQAYGQLGFRLMQADALELAGDSDTAGELFAAAGARRDAMRLAAKVKRKARRASFAVALTRREREVAHLLCERQSNRQIAAALRISERTVHHHVEAIFSKLGVRARWQVTRDTLRGAKAED